MEDLEIETKRGSILDGVLFCETKNPDTVLIAITGIHGNFFSNPFCIICLFFYEKLMAILNNNIILKIIKKVL